MIIDSLKSGKLNVNGQSALAFENMERFGYMLLSDPLKALNIVYPPPNSKDIDVKIIAFMKCLFLLDYLMYSSFFLIS